MEVVNAFVNADGTTQLANIPVISFGSTAEWIGLWSILLTQIWIWRLDRDLCATWTNLVFLDCFILWSYTQGASSFQVWAKTISNKHNKQISPSFSFFFDFLPHLHKKLSFSKKTTKNYQKREKLKAKITLT